MAHLGAYFVLLGGLGRIKTENQNFLRVIDGELAWPTGGPKIKTLVGSCSVSRPSFPPGGLVHIDASSPYS